MAVLNLNSGPRNQFLAWVGVSAAGLAFYIFAKGRTNEKKRLDSIAKLAAQQQEAQAIKDGNAPAPTPRTSRRGGVGLSSASAAYQNASKPKDSP